jgi:Uma2 family endonuclease
MIVSAIQRVAVPPPKEGPWRLPDHLDLPPAPLPRTDGAPPWCFPDHTMLPDKDGNPVKNAQEPLQSQLLTETIRPTLLQLFPDEQFLIGQDLGIFWRLIKPPLRGALAPDWFFVPDVPPLIDNELRRSYVLWQELEQPILVIEYVSGDGTEERDRTPEEGKMWIYEKRIRPYFYAIHDMVRGQLQVYRLLYPHSPARSRFKLLHANSRDHYRVGMGAELGIWRGRYQGEEWPWLRWWDLDGVLLPTGEESAAEQRHRAEQERHRAEQERHRAEQEQERAEQERQRAERLAEKLRSLGIDPESV